MKHYSPAGRRDFWIREIGTGQQVAQLHERYRVYQNDWSGFEVDYIQKYAEENYKY